MIVRDIYQLQIFKVHLGDRESITLTLVRDVNLGATPILFRQSPFDANEIMVLTEGSKFYTFSLNSGTDPVQVDALDINRQETVLKAYIKSKASQNTYGEPSKIDEQERKVAMFKQDIQCFDYGAHPLSILACNFRNVYLINRRQEISTA